MSGTRKMEKFELDTYVRAELEAAITPPANGELEVSGEVSGEVEVAKPKTDSHPPARPPTSSGPTLKQLQSEPSIVVAKPEPPPDPAALRTRLAKKFVSLADDVNEEFNEFSIGAGAWGVELTAPQGMSTGGGKQALQHLRMRPRRPGYSVLVGGTANQVEKTAELRDYEHMCMMHEVRFRKRLEITQNEWEQFLRKAEVVLREAEMQCVRVGPPKDLLAQRQALTKVSRVAAVVFVIVLVLAAIVLFRIFGS